MKAFHCIIFILILISCSNKYLNKGIIHIDNEGLYGKLLDGKPDRDTLVELKNSLGKIIGIGKMAMYDDNISNLKVGYWKEYDVFEGLNSEGIYKIGSYTDCCVSGACKQFYYYRDCVWKYYNKKGELIYKLEFKPAELKINTNCEGGDKLIFGLVDSISLDYIGKITNDDIYNLQKITYSDLYSKTTLTPLNGRLNIETNNNLN